MVVSGCEWTPVAELITAECTVVERTTDQSKGAAQRVVAHPVNFVGLAELRQFTAMAERALAPTLEDGDDGPVEVQAGAAVVAVE